MRSLLNSAPVINEIDISMTMIAPRPKAKPKRSRASAPKVRTGCLTCKTRHLKCGEEKPICARCQKDGFQCDGYIQNVVALTTNRKKAKTVYVPWLPAPRGTIDRGSDSERRFLHHVEQSTLKDLASSPSQVDFWHRLVLAPAHSSDAVRHALVALGAAHWLFLTRSRAPSPTNEAQNLQSLVFQQYNQAIQHLTSTMGGSETTDFHLTLVCCLLFYSLENMLGRYAESLQHLRAGSRLLASPNGHSPSAESSPKSFESDDAICEMAELFSTLGLQASMFLNEPVVDDLSSYARYKNANEDVSRPFANLADARSSLGDLEVDYNLALEHESDDRNNIVLTGIYDRFRQWTTRVEMSNFRTSSQEAHREYLALEVARRLWSIAVEPTENEAEDEVFTEVLNLIEMLITSPSQSSHPVFTLQADIVPALNFVCDASDDIHVQRRAIHLLRSAQRREGLWDSQEVAEYLEDAVTARKMLRHGWDNVLGGLPGAARALSRMNLSTLSPNNGILLMAEKTQVWEGD